MPKTTLLMVFHNHQPTGNLHEVFSSTTEDCYEPLVETLWNFPQLKFALHFSGPLWNWLEEFKPKVFNKVAEMVKREQVEVIGGGFYEPMLAILSERDATGQLKMMKDKISDRFGVEAEGMWTAERVWEPDLARIIANSGYKYTFLDDSHFKSAGLWGELDGYYTTEKAGKSIGVFPISQTLRYAIPFKDPEDAIKEILSLANAKGDDNVVLTYGDDGEKFGVWPGTKNLVWERGWLERFFTLLVENSPEIHTATPSEVIDTVLPKGRIYLPTASYEEMGEWSLTPDAQHTYKTTREVVSKVAQGIDTIKKKHLYMELITPLLHSIDRLPSGWLEKYLKLMDHGGLLFLSGSKRVLTKFDDKFPLLKKIESVMGVLEDIHPLFKGTGIVLNISKEIETLLDEILSPINFAADDASMMLSFVRGGIWQGFLGKYHESNLIHKRMLRVSERLEKLETHKTSIDESLLDKAKDHLYQAQCNCAYWHGIFGGLYMVHLRHALFDQLLKAEHLMDRYEDISGDSVEIYDFDSDFAEEIVLSGNDTCAIIKPSMGGSLLEYDIKQRYFNITNVMTRVEEGYHKDLQIKSDDEESSKETATIHHHVDYVDDEMMKHKIYDFYPRTAFQDYFFNSSVVPSEFLNQFSKRSFSSVSEFTIGEYIIKKSDDKKVSVQLEKTGLMNGIKIKIEKSYRLEKNILFVDYGFQLPAGGEIDFWFAPESSFSILSDASDDRRIVIDGVSPDGEEGRAGAKAIFEECSEAGMISYYDGFSFTLGMSEKATLLSYPFHSLSKSETGVELNYQGTSLTPFFKITLKGRRKKKLGFTLSSEVFPPKR